MPAKSFIRVTKVPEDEKWSFEAKEARPRESELTVHVSFIKRLFMLGLSEIIRNLHVNDHPKLTYRIMRCKTKRANDGRTHVRLVDISRR